MQRYHEDPKYLQKNSLIKAITINPLCDICMKKTPPPLECSHNLHTLPSHQDPSRRAIIEDLMLDGKEDAIDQFRQEVLNLPMGHSTALFKRDCLLHILQKSHVPLATIRTVYPDPTTLTVFTFIDPNGGTSKCFEGKNAFSSRLGICSVILDCPLPTHVTVLGKMAFPTNDEMALNAVLHSYAKHIHDHPYFGHCRHLIGVESNFSGSVGSDIHFNRIRDEMPHAHEFNPDPDAVYRVGHGIRTTKENKMLAGALLCRLVREQRLHLFKDYAFETSCIELMPPASSTMNDTSERAKWSRTDRILFDEMCRFQTVKGNYNAKANKETDDLIISLMMAHYWLNDHLSRRRRLAHVDTTARLSRYSF